MITTRQMLRQFKQANRQKQLRTLRYFCKKAQFFNRLFEQSGDISQWQKAFNAIRLSIFCHKHLKGVNQCQHQSSP